MLNPRAVEKNKVGNRTNRRLHRRRLVTELLEPRLLLTGFLQDSGRLHLEKPIMPADLSAFVHRLADSD